MQEDNFKSLLKDHARDFRMDVDPGLFDKVAEKRKARGKKPFVFMIAFVGLILSTVIGAITFNLLPLHSNEVSSPAVQETTVRQGPLTSAGISSSGDISTAIQPPNPPAHVPLTNTSRQSSAASPIHSAVPAHQPTAQQETPGSDPRSNPPAERVIPDTHSFVADLLLAANTTQAEPLSGVETEVVIKSRANHAQTKVKPATLSNETGAKAQSNEAAPAKAETHETSPGHIAPVAALAAGITENDSTKKSQVNDPVKPADDAIAQTARVDSALQGPFQTEEELRERWHVSVMGTGQFFNSAYSANSSADLAWYKEYYEHRKTSDKARFSYNAGMKLEYTPWKHFGFGAGLMYSVIQFQELQFVKDPEPRKVTTSGWGTSADKLAADPIDRNRFDISFASLEVPLTVNYNAGNKRFGWQVSTGITYSYLVRAQSLIFEPGDSSTVTETNDAGNSRLQQHRFSFIAGSYGIVKFSRHFGIYLGPVYRYSFGSLYNEDYVIRQKPWFIGAETGLKFSF
jgi:hypothetical protein